MAEKAETFSSASIMNTFVIYGIVYFVGCIIRQNRSL